MDDPNNEPGQQNKPLNSDPFNKFEPISPYPLIHPVAAAFIGLIGGFILYMGIGSFLTIIIASILGFDLLSPPVGFSRIMTIAGQILFILLPALLFAKWIYGNVSEVILIKLPNWKEVLFFVIGIAILTPLLQSYLYIQNFFIEKLAASSEFINSIKSMLDKLNELIEKTYINLIDAQTIPEMILVAFAIAVIPAFCEEIMFRGYIQKSFQFKMKPLLAAIITAVFFAGYHFNPYGIIPLFALGLYFGFAAYSSGSLVIPIILHFLNNFFAVMLYFTIGDEELLASDVTDPAALNSNIVFFVVLLFLFALVIFSIRYYYSKEKTT